MAEQTSPAESTNASPSGGSGKGVLWTVLVLIILIAAGAALLYLNPGFLSTGQDQTEGNVVATVNNTTITEQDVNERIERNRVTLEAQGINIDDPEVRTQIAAQFTNQIINETLVLADAASQGIQVTSEEVEAQYQEIRARFDSEDAFAAELSGNQFTQESLRENIRRELILQKYIEEVSNSEPIQVTEEEINTFYEQLAAQNENLPTLEELSSQIEDQIRNQKLAQIVNGIVEDLRAAADITIEASNTEGN